jgi:tRNA G18 (ribose-2'-O)-methylase SpoU
MSVIKATDFFKSQPFIGPDLILDGLQTPENIGSIFRLAGNLSCAKIIFTEATDLSPIRIAKLSRQNLAKLPIEFWSVEQILTHYPHLTALETGTGSTDIFNTDIPKSTAFVVGNESSGIQTQLFEACHLKLYIPMPGLVKSLNVSHALSIGLFEWYRKHHYQF